MIPTQKTEGEDNSLLRSENLKTEYFVPDVRNQAESNTHSSKTHNRLCPPRKVLSSMKVKYGDSQNCVRDSGIIRKSHDTPCQPSHQFTKPLNISSRVFEVQDIPQNRSERFFKKSDESAIPIRDFQRNHQPLSQGQFRVVEDKTSGSKSSVDEVTEVPRLVNSTPAPGKKLSSS